jgi:hypothetical protein
MQSAYIAGGTVKLRGTFEIASWDEAAYHEGGDRKLTLASVTQRFDGDVQGEGAARWLMAYRPDGTAHFVGLQRVDAEVDGSQGGLVLETVGDFDGHIARWTATVIDGAGDGDLAKAQGRGTFEAPMGSKASFELDVDLRG